MTLSFVYLIIASIFQLGWLYNMKRIKKGMWKEIRSGKLKAAFPILLYILFGIANVLFLTWSMEKIAPSIAYAVWTGIVIAAAAIIDQLLQKKPIKLAKIFFIAMILAGIIGLKMSTTN